MCKEMRGGRNVNGRVRNSGEGRLVGEQGGIVQGKIGRVTRVFCRVGDGGGMRQGGAGRGMGFVLITHPRFICTSATKV